MSIKGKMETCHRCNATVFLKLLECGRLDGGFGDEYEKYEELPDGWNYITAFSYLCPNCSYLLKSFVHDFFSNDNTRIAGVFDFTPDEKIKYDEGRSNNEQKE